MGYFKLKKRETNIKTEFTAGFTTFLTMMYLVLWGLMLISLMVWYWV